MSEQFQQVYAIIPSRVWNLPGLTMQLARFYEKINQFWQNGRECFLSNKSLMEYAGMKSDSSVRDAFTYFEMHGEIKRIKKGNKRYIIPKDLVVQCEEETKTVDKLPQNSTNSAQTSAPALVDQRHSAGGTSATALPNNNKYNNNKLNKSFYKEDNQKKHNWVNQNDVKSTIKFWGPGHPGYDSLHNKN